MKSWLLPILAWLLRIFIGPKPKSPRIRLEVKSEDVIAAERKRLEELKAEVRRIEDEMADIACKVTTAIIASDGHRIIELNTERGRLRNEWDVARQRLLDFAGHINQGG